jgi:Protein of unknown function (DUF998)
MTNDLTTPRARASGAPATRALLTGGAVAGPLFIVTGLLQAFTRDGFDLRRHPLSLLSDGDLGWVQIANFVVTGLLFIGAAVGMRRVMHPGRGGTWGPLLVGVVGVGLVAAGVFVADPADGFPPGTPPGRPDTLSWHGVLHFLVAGVAYLSLIAASFVFARRFTALGQRGWARYSAATGGVFLAAWLALFAWPEQDAVTLAYAAAALHGHGWVSVMAARLRTGLPAEPAAGDGLPADLRQRGTGALDAVHVAAS